MTPHPSTCTPHATAQAAALIMSEEDVGIVPIVDPETNRLLGVVTDRDLCLDVVAAGKHPETMRVESILHADPVTCHTEDDIALCLMRMEESQVRRIPIVDDAGACVGIIAQKDLVLHVTEPERLSSLLREISKSLGSNGPRGHGGAAGARA
jgi:CBS domain-containing protein